MTLNDLEVRLKSMEQEKAQLMANYNALEGAIQELNHWIRIAREKEMLASLPPSEPSNIEE